MFFKKLLISFLMPFLIVYPNAISEKLDDFETKIHESYESYVVEKYETENYTLIIVEGVCNSELMYGVFLGCIDANNYSLEVFVNNSKYSLESDSRGDVSAYCIERLVGETIIRVYDSEGYKRYEKTLVFNTKEALEMNSNCIRGNNMGCDSISKLIRDDSYNDIVKILIIVFTGVIVICSLLIIYLYVSKKGIFNKERKRMSDIEYFDVEIEKDDFGEAEIIEEKTVEKTEECYEKKLYFEEDVEEFDIKPYLKERGYKEDYLLMDEEEKNQVMVLLMTLKYKGIINEVQYQRECVELWKK